MEYYNSCCSFTKLRMTLWDPMDCSTPGFPALHYLLSFELEMPSNLLILCHLLLLPSIFPRISCPKYWSFSFSTCLSKEYSGLISFRIDLFDLLAFQGTPRSLLQHHSAKASILWRSAIFIVQLSYPSINNY